MRNRPPVEQPQQAFFVLQNLEKDCLIRGRVQKRISEIQPLFSEFVEQTKRLGGIQKIISAFSQKFLNFSHFFLNARFYRYIRWKSRKF